MKTLAAGCRISLRALAGFALVTWAAAASNPTTESPPGTPIANPTKESDSAKAVGPATPAQKASEGTSQVGHMVSFQAEEVVKLTEGNVGATVIQTQIAQSTMIKFPSADEILYLHQHGVSEEIIAAFIRRGGALRVQAEKTANGSQAGSTQPAPALLPAPATPAPASVPPPPYVYAPEPAPPVYSYTYPSYVYADYPSYGYVWPSFGWSVGYYSRPFARYGYGHPWPYRGGYSSSPRGWASGYANGPWASAVRPGSSPRGHVTFGARVGAGGHFSGGGLGRRPGR